MWELNYNDSFPSWTFNDVLEVLHSIEGSIQRSRISHSRISHSRNRNEDRKFRRRDRRVRAIRFKIVALLRGVSWQVAELFSESELDQLCVLATETEAYDYWPIPKTVTFKLRGIVKKQKHAPTITLYDLLRVRRERENT